jgi:hypothetical protein
VADLSDHAAMISEAPFLFAIAGLSASLAGLAGLVAALRRGSDLRPMDAFRLREIVEFSFANILFAVGMVPLSVILGVTDAVNIAALLVFAYTVGSSLILVGRSRRDSISFTRGWGSLAATLNLVILAAIAADLWTSSIIAYEVTLVALLTRPMLAFLLVLGSFEMTAPQQR